MAHDTLFDACRAPSFIFFDSGLDSRPAATYELQNEHHQCDEKQNVDVRTQNVETDETQ
jgi:hypothetical protein